MTKQKTELWWVSVGGNMGEPARVIRHGKSAMVYTIGCADGTLVTLDANNTDAAVGVTLIEEILPAAIPQTEAQAEKAWKAWRRKVKRDEAMGIHHGYRRFT